MYMYVVVTLFTVLVAVGTLIAVVALASAVSEGRRRRAAGAQVHQLRPRGNQASPSAA